VFAEPVTEVAGGAADDRVVLLVAVQPLEFAGGQVGHLARLFARVVEVTLLALAPLE
jgi:hypothetical protein